MKYCINCGAAMEDEALFCEQCGTKQESHPQKTHTPIQAEYQQNIPASTAAHSKSTNTFKRIVSITIIIISIIAIINMFKSFSSPESLEDVASDFAEALLIDFKAKKAVSLMSDELIDSYMEQQNFSSKKELINQLDEVLKIKKDDALGYYGEDWEAEIIDVEIQEVQNDLAVVLVTISHTGSDSLWDTNIDELWVYLVNQDDNWRVYDFEG